MEAKKGLSSNSKEEEKSYEKEKCTGKTTVTVTVTVTVTLWLMLCCAVWRKCSLAKCTVNCIPYPRMRTIQSWGRVNCIVLGDGN